VNAKRNANRSEGEEEAAKLRAETDKQRTIILGPMPSRRPQKLRGEGDAAAAQIYAQAYGPGLGVLQLRAPSLQAYEQFLGKRKHPAALRRLRPVPLT